MSTSFSHLKIFQGLDPSIIQEIIDSSETKMFMAGETILTQGDHPNGEGYIITKGEVQISTSSGAEHTMAAGDIFGEMALLSEEARSATVVATTELEVIVLSQDTLFQLMDRDDTSLSKEIMKRMEENLS